MKRKLICTADTVRGTTISKTSRSHVRSLSYFILVPIILTSSSCQNNASGIRAQYTEREATEFVKTYVQALSNGDSAQVLTFWSPRSVGDPSFWYMHAARGLRIPFSSWPDFLEIYTPEIRDVHPREDHAVIELTWAPRDTTVAQTVQPRDMRFYVAQESRRYVLINPIDILKRDWKSYESDYLIYHFPEEYLLEDHLHEIMANDQAIEDMLAFFDLKMTDRIPFYKVRTPAEAGEIFLQFPSNGYAVLPFDEQTDCPITAYKIISTSFYHPHEIAHCVAAIAGIPHDNAVITEGFGVALGGVAGAVSETSLQEARNLLQASKLLTLETLFTLPVPEFLQRNYITYYESGALIRFLYDRFGMNKLKRFCEQASSTDVFKSAENVLGASTTQLEKQFHTYLLGGERNTITFVIPSDAREVFAMEDPENDDVGDGDYRYPRHASFESGVFDLRRFTVFKDDGKAYFRATLSKLMSPLSYGSSDEQFSPCITIAINYGTNDERPLKHDCHGIQFPSGEGYDVKLNIGSAVSISSPLGKAYYTTPDIVYDSVNKEEHSIEVAIPIDIIGEPNEGWKYFVGVGLTSNRTMNFLYDGPMPVQRDNPVFISGGDFAYGNPDFIDILWVSSHEQERILGEYDVTKNIKPIVPMIGPAN